MPQVLITFKREVRIRATLASITLRMLRGPSYTILNLKGAAESAEGIRKYGRFGYLFHIASEMARLNPRGNCIITGIEDPPKDY